MFETEFLSNSPESHRAYREAIAAAVETLCRNFPAHPFTGKSPAALGELFEANVMSERGLTVDDAVGRLAAVISESLVVSHPNTIAHLHSPPLIAALAAEVVISALNQSMDSFDQSPAGTVLEEKMVRWLCDEVGLGQRATGIFTAGGTQSNYMGLLLARDACIEQRWNCPVRTRGLPKEADKLRILCSDVAHFTVEKSAAQLGLGTDAVLRVATDDRFRMRVHSLKEELLRLQRGGLIAMAIVGTAGTTDFGSVDPLPELSNLAQSEGAWFHVDAAYGSALLFSHSRRELLHGIERANSLSVDFHKLFWQPISCAAFLVRDAEQFRHMRLHADYLNPEAHERLGIPNLVTRSVATTRRFDALKLWISLQALGRRKLGEMIDATIALALHGAQCIKRNPHLELIHEPELGCVAFRFQPSDSAVDSNALNMILRQRLFDRGLAVLGHTVVRGRQCLKLTCMNPSVSTAQIEQLIGLVVEEGIALERGTEGA